MHQQHNSHNVHLAAPGGLARACGAAELLSELIARASPHDPHKNRSNAGRWVTINAPRDLVERARALLSPETLSQPVPASEAGPNGHSAALTAEAGSPEFGVLPPC
jgi:hypothetical protein